MKTKWTAQIVSLFSMCCQFALSFLQEKDAKTFWYYVVVPVKFNLKLEMGFFFFSFFVITIQRQYKSVCPNDSVVFTTRSNAHSSCSLLLNRITNLQKRKLRCRAQCGNPLQTFFPSFALKV